MPEDAAALDGTGLVPPMASVREAAPAPALAEFSRRLAFAFATSFRIINTATRSSSVISRALPLKRCCRLFAFLIVFASCIFSCRNRSCCLRSSKILSRMGSSGSVSTTMREAAIMISAGLGTEPVAAMALAVWHGRQADGTSALRGARSDGQAPPAGSSWHHRLRMEGGMRSRLMLLPFRLCSCVRWARRRLRASGPRSRRQAQGAEAGLRRRDAPPGQSAGEARGLPPAQELAPPR